MSNADRIDQLKGYISVVRKEIRDREGRIREMEGEIALLLSQYKVGDVIYSRRFRRKMRVTGWRLGFSDMVVYEACKILKDGSDGVNRYEVHSAHIDPVEEL